MAQRYSFYLNVKVIYLQTLSESEKNDFLDKLAEE